MTAAWRREECVTGQPTLVLELHVQPGASRTEVAGTHGDALKVRLAAPPVDGKANAELLRFLAEAFGVPRRDVTLLRGESSRAKVVRITRPAARPDLGWE
jgi:uncharacterized protein (TIGR00251 family)